MSITKYFVAPFSATLMLSAALSAVPGIAPASGIIQGEKIDDQGNLFTSASMAIGADIEIRGATP